MPQPASPTPGAVPREPRHSGSAAAVARRIVCGVDGSPRSLAATALAARLIDADGTLTLIAALDDWNPIAPEVTGAERTSEADVRPRATLALAVAERAASRSQATIESAIRSGWAPRVLLDEAEARAATLIAVGMHDRSRRAGYLLGSVATAILHDARSSVLVARPAAGARRVVVGLDGSTQSLDALTLARVLAARLDASLLAVCATGGKPVDVPAVRAQAGDDLHVDPRPPVVALAAAAASAELLVLGSRGRHGVGTLGSVSERVAHRAPCSVLIYRERASITHL